MSHSKGVRFFAVAAISALLCPQPAFAAGQVERQRIGIAFDEGTRYDYDLNGVYQEVFARVGALGRFSLVDRQELKRVLDEHRLSLAGITDDPSKNLTGLETADLLVVLGITSQESEYVSGSGSSRGHYVCRWRGFVKVVDAKKDTVAVADEVVGADSDESSSTANSGARKDFIEEVMIKLRTAFALESKVVDRGLRSVRINRGSDQAIRPGFFFDAVRYGDPVKDPSTGEILGAKSESIGQVIITDVYPGFSEGFIYKGTYSIKNGDVLKENPQGSTQALVVEGAYQPALGTSGFLSGQGAFGTDFMVPGLMGMELTPTLGLGFGSGPSASLINLGLSGKAKIDVIPEVLGLYGRGGFQFSMASQPLSAQAAQRFSSKDDASASAFQFPVGVGAELNIWGPLVAFIEADYTMPTVLSSWKVYHGQGTDPTPLAASDVQNPTVALGGIGAQAGLILKFWGMSPNKLWRN